MSGPGAIGVDRVETHVLDWVDDVGPFDPGRLTAVALGAFGAIEAVCRPLAVEIALACADPATGDAVGPRPVPAGRLLVHVDAPATLEVEATYRDVERVVVEDLARPTIAEQLARAAWCDGGVALWDELLVAALAAPLPFAVEPGARDLVVGDGGRRVLLSWRDGRPFALAPLAGVAPPLGFALRRESGALTVRLEVGWSSWQRGGPGAPAIDGLVAALRADGWRAS